MIHRLARPLFGVLALALAAPAGALPEPPAPSFERDVRPILKAYCFDCHGAHPEPKGRLDLRLKRFMLRGGEMGPAIVPNDSNASLLIDRVRAGEMPPGEKKLPQADVATLIRWVDAGAATLREEPETLPPGIPISEEERAFWAFQPVRAVQPPSFGPEAPVRTPVDAFILQKLRENGLEFAPEADKLTLLRRACFDLTGLPPSREQTRQFLEDNAPDAYERLIDRLLKSPHYAERWARHWLDVAGYADSDGATAADARRPYAYKYRDYVIRAIQHDKRLDQFITEQLAGDELVPQPHVNLSPEQIELLAATGFLRNAADGTGSNPADPDLAKNQVMADTIKIVSTSLMGLSMGCAQCHDHRYDPISQEDYYRLRAVFEPALDWKNWRAPSQRLVSLYTQADRQAAARIEDEARKIEAEKSQKQQEYLAAALEKELAKYPEELRAALRDACNAQPGKRTPEQVKLLDEHPSLNITPGVLYQYDAKAAEDLKNFDKRAAEIRAGKPVEDFVSLLNEIPGQASPTYLFHRGDHRQPKHAVQPGAPRIFWPNDQPVDFPLDDPALPTTGRRLALARWLTSGTHPLVGRVLVNRIWLHHMGRGLVDTPGDFGMLGSRPSHPELLDWLAAELVRQNWSLAAMHRLLMTSTVYRQSSRRTPQLEAVDADNRLYGRANVRRLEAEAIRDSMLFAAGRLDTTPFGPPVAISEDFVGQVVVANDAPRKSLYVEVRRSRPVSMLAAFDAPVMEVNCEVRSASTVAPQALVLMNNDFVVNQALAFARRLAQEARAETGQELIDRLAERVRHPVRAWQHGFGGYDDQAARVASFQPLPHWTGSAWQGGAQLPDRAHGWVLLNAQGGHPGDDQAHAAIRRWVAPASGRLAISGMLAHPADNGDGVRARVVSSRAGLAGQWLARAAQVETPLPALEVRAGDTIDFVVDCRESATSDSFTWQVELRLADTEGRALATWHSEKGFAGPPGPPLERQALLAWQLAFQREPTQEELLHLVRFLSSQLMHLAAAGNPADAEQTAMQSLCQVLLTSNEFLYVD